MPTALELLREGRNQELWQKCCGFIDLSLEEFMSIQKRLLLEQMELLKKCELGEKIMRGARPRTVEEFRAVVPVTKYADYAPYLQEKIEDALPAKPMLWQRTSGRSEQYSFKWIPTPRKLYEELGEIFLAVLIFASCNERNDIVLEEHDKLLYAMAPPPYVSGSWIHRAAEENVFDILPPLDLAEKMAFEERIEEGFKLALTEGLDLLFAITGVLLMIGEQFSSSGGIKRLIALMDKPKLLLRMSRAFARSKIARRKLLPKDVWRLKSLIAGGTDTAVYRERIKEMWGRYPLDVYGCTEGVMIAMQTWDYQGMSFIPHINLLEFMPDEEYKKWQKDPEYKPELFLLDEVIPDKKYALVITNFHGGSLVRYFLGDVIKITSLRNETLNIDIPQMLFYSRVDGVIDIDGCIHMTESTIWQAIENSGLVYRDWVVKQEDGAKPKIHIFVEPGEEAEIDKNTAVTIIRRELMEMDPFYGVLESRRDVALEVTALPCGAFKAYMERQRAAGADLAHLKPPHINPPDDIIDFLLNPIL